MTLKDEIPKDKKVKDKTFKDKTFKDKTSEPNTIKTQTLEPKTLKLAVNGTLMRGLALCPNLLNVGATFEREAKTEPAYRIWSIGDRYPAMIRVRNGGAAIAVEVWNVPLAGLGIVLSQEPPGLAVGKVRLQDGEEVLGVIGEPLTVEGQKEITQYGGWRAYQTIIQG